MSKPLAKRTARPARAAAPIASLAGANVPESTSEGDEHG
jgi:hypothetical protein